MNVLFEFEDFYWLNDIYHNLCRSTKPWICKNNVRDLLAESFLHQRNHLRNPQFLSFVIDVQLPTLPVVPACRKQKTPNNFTLLSLRSSVGPRWQLRGRTRSKRPFLRGKNSGSFVGGTEEKRVRSISLWTKTNLEILQFLGRK